MLVATKLHIPQVRPEAVTRRELVDRLVAGGDRKLAAVCAPAGWGKTILLSEWSAATEESRAFAWVSLDRGDDDPVRFWSYAIAALQTVEPEIGRGASAALANAGPDLVDVVPPLLINDLAALSRRLVLVLDDYHVVRQPLIHASVTYLLQHLPRTLQVAIASRADPPLPLGAMRAAGEVTEIRVAELRFNDAEADTLLNGSLGLGLDSADVERLQVRTEGWAAGLQLAALSLQTHDDRHAFVEAFAGDDRYIGDYLHEVLAEQPPERREFLLRTSILERMCAALCDAVTGSLDSARRLEDIHRSNLFLVSIDTRASWFRYHHLFRELLRYELERHEAAVVPELHRRASAWHEAQGFADEAIVHAVAAGDDERARELVAEHWRRVVFRPGDAEMVLRWFEALPSAVVAADVRLCIGRGWTSLVVGRHAEAATWLRAAERCPPPPGPLYELSSIDAALARLRSEHALTCGDVGRALKASREEVALAPDTSRAEAVAKTTLGAALYFAGEPAEAEVALDEGRRGPLDDARAVTRAELLGYLSVLRAEADELEHADRLASEAERLIVEGGLAEAPWTSIVHFARATVFELRGDPAGAESSFTRAALLARRGGLRLSHADALLALARLKRKQRDYESARSFAREAREVLALCFDPGALSEKLARAEQTLQLVPARRVAAGPADPDLSEREVEILRLLASDLSQREIGSELFVSFNTVKAHTRSIFRKLGVASRADAVARARELGLL